MAVVDVNPPSGQPNLDDEPDAPLIGKAEKSKKASKKKKKRRGKSLAHNNYTVLTDFF